MAVFGRNSLAVRQKTTNSPTSCIDILNPIAPVRLEWTDQGLSYLHLNINPRKPQKDQKVPSEIKLLSEQVLQYFLGRLKVFDFCWYDQSTCSDFQLRVYKAAQKIPFGHKITYSELAADIGNPLAIRAVGTALGKNPWPILIPCHRIVAKNGIGGFSAPGGINTKQSLLGLEA